MLTDILVLGRATTGSTPSDSYIYLPLNLGQESVTISLKTGSDVILEMAAIDCRKGDIRESKVPCKNKSVLSNRKSFKGANNAVEKHVSRALESDKIMRRCSSVAIQEVYEARRFIAQIIFVLHFYSSFKFEDVCRGGCGLVVIFELLFILDFTVPYIVCHLHKHFSEC